MSVNEIELKVWDFIFNSIMWNSSAFFVKVTQEMKDKDEGLKNAKVGEWITKGNVTE